MKNSYKLIEFFNVVAFVVDKRLDVLPNLALIAVINGRLGAESSSTIKNPKTAKYLPVVVPSALAVTMCNSAAAYLPSTVCSEGAWK